MLFITELDGPVANLLLHVRREGFPRRLGFSVHFTGQHAL